MTAETTLLPYSLRTGSGPQSLLPLINVKMIDDAVQVFLVFPCPYITGGKVTIHGVPRTDPRSSNVSLPISGNVK
jgi:hypothetical protein